MPSYRNRPDRRVLRVVSPLIQPVVKYSGAYDGTTAAVFTFLQDVIVTGIPQILCVDGTGGLIAQSVSYTQPGPAELRVVFSAAIDTATYLFFFKAGQSAVRGVTGGFPTSEPVPVFSQ